MEPQAKKKVQVKEIVFYALGALMIAAFVVLYFPRFIGVAKVPDAIRFLYRDLGPGWAIAANAGLRSEERRVGKECRARGSPYH